MRSFYNYLFIAMIIGGPFFIDFMPREKEIRKERTVSSLDVISIPQG